jgi:hypothetical protein
VSSRSDDRSALDVIDDLNDWRVTSWVAEELFKGKQVRFYRDTERFHVSTGRSGWGQYRIVSLVDVLEGRV